MKPIATVPIVGLMIMTGLSFSINGSDHGKNQALSNNRVLLW